MDRTAHEPTRSVATPVARVPLQVRIFSPILKALLAVRVPLGYNRLVTIRGRRTGLPRTAAIAVLEISGRRWVWAPWGEVNWVRNLRAAGRATIRRRDGQLEEVRATEFDADERVEFFRDVLAPFAKSLPLGVTFIKLVDGVDVSDPVRAADGRRVFELHPL
jgi:deazaflavin-dependent oxidoreductase (nitroreductase family)